MSRGDTHARPAPSVAAPSAHADTRAQHAAKAPGPSPHGDAPARHPPPHVAILGGGVGGLSAADALVRRGVQVSIYEKSAVFGGKARSDEVPGSASDGRRPLPGEHGFRFFPGFYRHIFATLRDIPFTDPKGRKRSVYDNLVQAQVLTLRRKGVADARLPVAWPRSPEQLAAALGDLLTLDVGLSVDDVALFARKLFILMTSCQARRFDDWERMPWWEFIEAQGRSQAYQSLLGQGLTRALVAMQPNQGSTRTVGYILLQLLYALADPTNAMDRLLDGPTNDAWLDPWIADLERRGVQFHPHAPVRRLHVNDDRLTQATCMTAAGPRTVIADHYILALPVDRVVPLLDAPLLAAAPQLAGLKELQTAWMSGLQFYLDRPVTANPGHILYVDAPWALTAISQAHFWQPLQLSEAFGDGHTRGILSVDISNWDAPGILFGKPARACTHDEIRQEVVAQLKLHRNTDGPNSFDAATILDWRLDDAVHVDPPHTRNAEPLLVNTVDSWRHRPEAAGFGIANLSLASDYVRTYTDLATMEAATEAARRAVNAALDQLGSTAPRCEVWPLPEPAPLAPLQWLDQLRYDAGLPHVLD